MSDVSVITEILDYGPSAILAVVTIFMYRHFTKQIEKLEERVEKSEAKREQLMIDYLESLNLIVSKHQEIMNHMAGLPKAVREEMDGQFRGILEDIKRAINGIEK